MDDNPIPKRERALALRKSWLARIIAKPLFIRANQLNIAYFSRLFPRWNTYVSESVVSYNPNIHLETWQRQDLLVCARFSYILTARFLHLLKFKMPIL